MRKIILAFFSVVIVIACTRQYANLLNSGGTEVNYNASQKPFYHGIDSGDPLQNGCEHPPPQPERQKHSHE